MPFIEACDIWRILKGAGIKGVKFVVVDIHGIPKDLTVDIDTARDYFENGVNLEIPKTRLKTYLELKYKEWIEYLDKNGS